MSRTPGYNKGRGDLLEFTLVNPITGETYRHIYQPKGKTNQVYPTTIKTTNPYNYNNETFNRNNQYNYAFFGQSIPATNNSSNTNENFFSYGFYTPINYIYFIK